MESRNDVKGMNYIGKIKYTSVDINTLVLRYVEHPRKGNIFVTHDKASTTYGMSKVKCLMFEV